MNEETISVIMKRNGDVTRLLARRRDLLSHISNLESHTAPVVQITVRTSGTMFEMRVLPETLHRTLEIDLAAVERELCAIAAVPLDWNEAAAAQPATLTGDATHG